MIDTKCNIASETRHSSWIGRGGPILVFGCVAAGLLFWPPSRCGAGAPTTDNVPSAEDLLTAMYAGIESASTGVVDVDVDTTNARNATPLRTSYVVTFDDSKKMLRCDRARRSRRSKFIRTPTESIFQLTSEPSASSVQIGPPDRDFAGTDDGVLDPHLLWLGGAAPFIFSPNYQRVSRRLHDQLSSATVSTDSEGRFRLRWTQRIQNNEVDMNQTLTIDPTRGFVPVRNEIASGFVGSTKTTINELSEIRYEQKNSCFIPVGLQIRGNSSLRIAVTCRWERVNEAIDPSAFTIDGFAPKNGTPIRDFRTPKPVVVGFTGAPLPPLSESPKTAFWHSKLSLLLIGNVALLALIAGSLLWRRVRGGSGS
jgi:hypothetical protein